MNRVTAIVAATAAVVVLGAALYQINSPPETERKSTNSTGFVLPEIVPAPGFAAEQVREIQKGVCGGIGKDDWLPQEVVFAYLEPREAVFRIPCGIGPAGHFFRTFYFSGMGPMIIDEYHPNAQLLFEVDSKEQAAEYVMYFSVVLAGEMDNKQFVLTEDQFDRWAEQCNSDTSVGKELTVAKAGEDHIVDLNFVDKVSGSFEHRQYMVTRDGAITLLGEKPLGSCGLGI